MLLVDGLLRMDVIGEHGDSEFTLWSSALVGSEKIDKYLTEEEKESIEKEEMKKD